MGNVPRHGRRAGVLAAVVIIPILAMSLFAAGQPDAANLKVVAGVVRSVHGTEINLSGTTFNIAGVPLRTGDLKPFPLSELSPGMTVELYFRGDKLLFVHVNPVKMMVE